jgi:hypothetical protein
MYTADIIQITFICVITFIFLLCFSKCIYELRIVDKLEKKYRLLSVIQNSNIEIVSQ